MTVAVLIIAALLLAVAVNCGVKVDPRMRPDHPCRQTVDLPNCPSKADREGR